MMGIGEVGLDPGDRQAGPAVCASRPRLRNDRGASPSLPRLQKAMVHPG